MTGVTSMSLEVAEVGHARHGPIPSKSVTICVKKEHWSARHAFSGTLLPPHPVISAPEHLGDGHAQARDERDEHVTGGC